MFWGFFFVAIVLFTFAFTVCVLFRLFCDDWSPSVIEVLDKASFADLSSVYWVTQGSYLMSLIFARRNGSVCSICFKAYFALDERWSGSSY